MMPMVRAEIAAVLLVFVVGSYLFRNYGRPWWRARGIQREIDALDYGRVTPPNPALHFSGLSDLKASEQRDQIRVGREQREAARLRLVITGSSRRVH